MILLNASGYNKYLIFLVASLDWIVDFWSMLNSYQKTLFRDTGRYVYFITEGEYDDYRILAAFSNGADASKFKSKLDSNVEIECWPLSRLNE